MSVTFNLVNPIIFPIIFIINQLWEDMIWPWVSPQEFGILSAIWYSFTVCNELKELKTFFRKKCMILLVLRNFCHCYGKAKPSSKLYLTGVDEPQYETTVHCDYLRNASLIHAWKLLKRAYELVKNITSSTHAFFCTYVLLLLCTIFASGAVQLW